MKILFWHRTNKINNRGEAPIYCRLTINKTRGKDFSTGVFCTPGVFIPKKQIINNPILNMQLESIKNKIMKFYIELENKDQIITSDILCNFLKGKNTHTGLLKTEIFKYLEHRHKLSIIGEIAPQTLRINENFSSNLINFLQLNKKASVNITEINCNMANEFYYWLLEHKKVCKTYAVKNIQFLKAVINHSVLTGSISYNPIVMMRFKRSKNKRIEYLAPEELNKLQAHKFASERLQQVADLFILQCHTGFAYVDLMNFDINKHLETDIKNRTWITLERMKSGGESVLPLFTEAEKIINKYTRKIESKKKLQLPQITNQKYNAYLKEIAEILGIETNLTTHIGRKTFGTIALNNGYSIESVSRMLGHSSIKTTQSHYTIVLRQRIVNEN